MSLLSQSPALRGLLISALGMMVISPDGVLLHMLTGTPLMDVVFYRTLGMGLTLLGVIAILHRGRVFGELRSLGTNGWLAVAVMSLSNILFVDAMAHTSVANTLVFMASMPLWSAIFGLIILREKVRGSTWVSIGLGLAGISVIMSDSLTLGGDSLRGDLAAMGAAMAHGLDLVLLRRAGDRDMTSTVMLSGFVTALVCLPFISLPFAIGSFEATSAIPAADWLILAALGLFILPTALGLFIAGARTAPAAEVALLSLVETLLGPLWAWMILDHMPSSAAFSGGGLILIAVALPAAATIWRRKQRQKKAALEIG